MAFVRRILNEANPEDRPILRKVAKKMNPAELQDPLVQQLIDDMFVTMYDAPGIGLAAPQVGVSKRLFVLHLFDHDVEHGPVAVINPRFTLKEGEVEATEGCLSVPGMVGELTRFESVTVTGIDRNGEKVELSGSGLFARCLQHEIDHLDGVLYIDKARNIRPAVTDDEVEAAEDAQAQAV